MKKITLIAASLIVLMSCQKETITLDSETDNFRSSKTVDYFVDNTWQLTETNKNEVSTEGDSSIWKFYDTRVEINNVMHRMIKTGASISIQKEVPLDGFILSLDSLSMQIQRLDSTVFVFRKY
tara:strand:- start:975 stop:1343 length:369 start_codon:yes stop_codon:yes gene_type:complete